MVLEATFDNIPNVRFLLYTAPEVIDLPLKLPDGQLFQLLGIKYYSSYEMEGQLKIWHAFVLECPHYNSIGDWFSSLFQNVVLGSGKSFVHLCHQVSLYLIEANTICYDRD